MYNFSVIFAALFGILFFVYILIALGESESRLLVVDSPQIFANSRQRRKNYGQNKDLGKKSAPLPNSRTKNKKISLIFLTKYILNERIAILRIKRLIFHAEISLNFHPSQLLTKKSILNEIDINYVSIIDNFHN